MGLTFGQYIAVEWLLVFLCLSVIIARLAVRTVQGIWSFWLSELFLVASFLAFIPLVIGDTYTFANGHQFQEDTYSKGLAKWGFASTLIFDLGFYLARFSLLAFYNELFPISETRLRISLWVVVTYNVIGFLATAFIDTFWCGADISQNWADREPSCSASADPTTAHIIWPINVSSEILVFLLPFLILPRLNKLNQKEKISLVGIFLLGFATVLVSIARFVLGVIQLFTLVAYLLGSVETATQIIVVALPALRPLLGMISTKRCKIPKCNTNQIHSQSSQCRSYQNFSDASTSLNTETVLQFRRNVPFIGERDGDLEMQNLDGRPPWEDVKLPKYLDGK